MFNNSSVFSGLKLLAAITYILAGSGAALLRAIQVILHGIRVNDSPFNGRGELDLILKGPSHEGSTGQPRLACYCFPEPPRVKT